MHRLTALCVRHPWLTLLVAVAAAVTAARATLRTELSVGMGSTLGGDHPVLREFDAFLERFGGGYPVLIAYECERPAPCEGALDPAALEMADAVSRELVRSRFVSRVASPATGRAPRPLSASPNARFSASPPSRAPWVWLLRERVPTPAFEGAPATFATWGGHAIGLLTDRGRQPNPTATQLHDVPRS